MNHQLIECVPNFSEGRDKKIINEIAAAIQAKKDIQLLEIDPNEDANRTVITFAGSPEAVIEAAFAGIAKASKLIDMSQQKGAHPRIGATDVCPLVPLQGISMEETVKYAHKLANRVAVNFVSLFIAMNMRLFAQSVKIGFYPPRRVRKFSKKNATN
jgi:Glutamate formiminotransferase